MGISAGVWLPGVYSGLVLENLCCLLFLSLLHPTNLVVIYVLVGGIRGFVVFENVILVLVRKVWDFAPASIGMGGRVVVNYLRSCARA